MTVTDHPAVAAYLARFDALSQHLPQGRRAELRADLLEHLAEAIPASADDATVRNALDRLGPPEDILSAEQGPAAPTPMTPAAPRPSLVHEGLAVAFLTAGSFIPVLGWLVGVVLLWTSKKWTPGEKLTGTLLVPGGPGTLVVVVGLGTLTAAQVCTSGTVAQATPGATEAPLQCSGGPSQPQTAILSVLLLVAVVVSFVVPALLYRRAARRAQQA